MKARKLSECYREIEMFFSASIDDVIREVAQTVKKIPPEKKDGYLSASSLPYLCPRKEAICLTEDFTRTDVIKPELQMIFETGNAFQVIIRDMVAKKGILQGMWRCKTCDYVHGSTDGEFTINSRGEKESHLKARITRPRKCGIEIDGYGTCDGDKFEYIEETIIDDNEEIIGHPDGFISNARYDHVWEIKTVNNFRYKEAKQAPFHEHLEQSMWYAFKTNKRGVILTYFNKDNGSFCSHVLDLSQEIVSNVLRRARSTRSAIKEFYETGSINQMPERICQSMSDPMAKRCEVCDKCFSIDFPSAH